MLITFPWEPVFEALDGTGPPHRTWVVRTMEDRGYENQFYQGKPAIITEITDFFERESFDLDVRLNDDGKRATIIAKK